MRKILLGLVATAAIASPIALASSADAATTDGNGVVTVAKAEVMQPLGLNEAAFQNGPKVLTGSNVFTATTTTGVGCKDGTVQYHERNTILTSPIDFAPIINAANRKTTGWTMTQGASVITESNSYGTEASGRFPDYATICTGHGGVKVYTKSLVQSHSDKTTTTFNGKDVSIVVNPYVAPVPIV
jgi:hypothetical protein